ncbi:MAG: hypothetical protein RR827_06605 [Oscillospiraceae bacterium]
MKRNNLKKITSFGMILAMVFSMIVPGFPLTASAVTGVEFVIDESQSTVVTDYALSANGVAVTEVKKGETVDIVLNVIDNRVTYKTVAPTPSPAPTVAPTPPPAPDVTNVQINISQGAFSGGSVVVEAINDVGATAAGNKIMAYRVKFTGVKYEGGGKDLAFEIGYNNGTGVNIMSVKRITQTISQAFDVEKQVLENTIDSSKPIYVTNYVVLDVQGNELTTVNPGQTVMIALNIADERIMHIQGRQPTNVRARLSQGAFVSNDAENVSYTIRDLAAPGAKVPFQYAVVFRDVKYVGGVPEISFDISYPSDKNIPMTLPNAILKQKITQAVDDIPEPKVILNSANYGGVAVIGKNFTLSTVATNTSEFVSLDNVSVRVELPKGMEMASGNSQVLIGTVAKKGQISHGFNLVVSGVENNVTSLPIKLIYEFEAYVKGERKTYKTEQDVSVSIEQATKFDISKLDFMETVNAGEEAYINVSLVNKGKATVNNVTAEIKSENINGTQTTFVGNVQPGSEATAEIYFPVTAAGAIKGKVIVTYEDAGGKSNTIERDFAMEAMDMPNMPGDMPTDIPMEPEKKGISLWLIGAVVLVAGGAAGFVIYKKRKQAKKEAEDNDEDI